MKTQTVIAAALVLLIAVPVAAQDSDYPVVVVNYRELRLAPEDLTALTAISPQFTSNHALSELLADNDTLFWEPLGGSDRDLSANSSVSSFAVVQINETGFYETIIGLSPDNQTLEWVTFLNSSVSANFSTIAIAATDFFVDDGRYWGLCEEIVVLPGHLVGLDVDYVWRLAFHLMAESERWALLLESSGFILDTQYSQIPCQTCYDYSLLIAGAAIVTAVVVFALVVMWTRRHQ
ncbi:MAG: hypothetical protein KAU89_07670 [Candidatus Thorarchaeota archaeon]|nr:hypothetical protein [Candidatus Thorarchaeota archaeon]